MRSVTRCIPPSETIRRVMPLLPLMGVTRVSEVTGLDQVGIPNFMSVRPDGRGAGQPRWIPGIGAEEELGLRRRRFHAREDSG